MTDAPNTPNSQLPLQPAGDAAQTPSPAAAEKAAAEKAAAEKAAGSGAKTKGKVTAPKKAAGKAVGARARKNASARAATAAPTDEDRVSVVLLTSRFRGRDGRAIARRTPVLVTVDRGLQLIMQGYAREAVEGDKPAVAYLD